MIIQPMISMQSLWNKTEIRYTLDGNEPTISSALFSEPFKISANTILKARSFNRTGLGSNITEALYQKVQPIPAAEARDLKAGLNYRYYEGQWTNLPSFDDLQPLKRGITKAPDLTAVETGEDHYVLVFEDYAGEFLQLNYIEPEMNNRFCPLSGFSIERGTIFPENESKRNSI